VATNFQLPVNIAFVPSPSPEPDAPFFYVTELYGTIKVVSNDRTVSDYATGLLNFNPTGDFPGSGEQGLTGITVDPASGDVYATMLYKVGSFLYPKVVRFHSLDGGRTAQSQTVILDMYPENQGPSHQISNVSIGPDSKLYVHMGDGFSAATAGNLDSFRGKILRLQLDGSPAADNPFYNAQDGITARDYIYAYGLRNPFGGAWSAADGAHYSVENGPSTDRFARIVAGRNYGWRGNNSDMTTFALYNWTPSVAPVNIAFIQPETFNGSGFPAEKMGHAFISESGPTYAAGPVANGKRISEFVLDAQGNLVDGPLPLIEYNGTGQGTVVPLAAGPDGLYFSEFYKDFKAGSPIDRGARILLVKAQSFTSASITLPADADIIRALARKPVSSAHILSTDTLAGQVAFDVTADVCVVLEGGSNDRGLLRLPEEYPGSALFATRDNPDGGGPQLVLTFKTDGQETCGQE
jgi:glucose/arabinose dehydrogenase